VMEEAKPKINPTLFFTYPAKHNGNYAEFVNIKEYVSGHMDQQAADAFRLFFSAYLSKNLRSKSGTVLVPREKMDELLQKLAGDHGLTVSELKASE
jgi:hypothetical protein